MENKPAKYVYFISYAYGIKENEVQPDTKVPVDNIILVLDNDIKSVEAVENAEAEISKKTNRTDVTIISFQFLGN